MEILVDAGLDVNIRTRQELRSDAPIGLAISNGHLEAVRWLLEHGADISKPVIGKQTAIELAEEKGAPEILRLVKEYSK